MQIICISKGTFSGGKELAKRLAKKLDYTCLSREELIEAATKEGIPVGKLEMAMIKPRIFSERLALEKEHYRAFSTAYLCDRAIEGRLVYHGRTGHLLLPGVSHVLRVRAISDDEYRIRSAMNEMGVERTKASRYLEEVDEDWRRWVHSMYEVSLEDAAQYDMIINLEQMSVENAATALTTVAQLPDFQMTPASKKTMLDLRLAAHARLALAKDERTFGANFNVRADAGVVTVTYLPQDSRYSELILNVLASVKGVTEVQATMATTNILWIQEEYQPHSELYNQVIEIATKWNAAVELVRLAPEEETPVSEGETTAETVAHPSSPQYNGGIEEDAPEAMDENGELKHTLDELARIGRSGGGRVVHGDQYQLINTLDRTVSYSLVVVGDVFLSKGHSARLRATRDLRSYVSDRIKAPVVTSDELGSQYLFGKRDIPKVAAFLIVTVAIYFLVFTHQEFILAFLANAGWYADAVKDTFLAKVDWGPQIIVSLGVFILVPIVAYTYGSVAGTLLKLIKME